MFCTKATSHCALHGKWLNFIFTAWCPLYTADLEYLKLYVWILGKIENFSSKKQDFSPTLMYNLIKLDLNLQ